jgi:serine/threonine protein kinase
MYADSGCYSLDSSNSGVTTTAGPPTHSTRRYSAPEVFNHSPRSRLTDIWSLGCVLADIVSRLLGHTLEEMRTFWSLHGSRIDSYAENPVATSGWLTYIQSSPGGWTYDWRTKIWLVSFIKLILLEKDRLTRPTAQEILTRLRSLLTRIPYMHRHDDLEHYWLGACCAPPLDYARVESIWRQPLFQPAVDILNIDSHLETIILGLDLSIVASKTQYDRKLDIKTLLCGENDLEILQGVASDLDLQIISDPAFTHCNFPDPVLLSLSFKEYARSLYKYPSRTAGVRSQHVFELRHPNDVAAAYDVYFFTAVLDFGSGTPGIFVPFVAMCFEPHLASSPGIYNPSRSPGDGS